MTDAFFERPILNSAYAIPSRHWALERALTMVTGFRCCAATAHSRREDA